MIVTTMNDLPGYEIEEVLGEVFGLTVRARNVGSQIGASLKSLVGGELKGMTKMLAEGRVHAQERAGRGSRVQGGQRGGRVSLRYLRAGCDLDGDLRVWDGGTRDAALIAPTLRRRSLN
jgi:Putative heavy-metal-binding